MTEPTSPRPADRLIAFLQLRWLGRERITAYSCILFAVLLAGLIFYFFEATGKTGSDFLAFWSAGRLVTQGEAARAYDPSAVGAVQAAIGYDTFAFVNPPPFLFAIAPFGLLSYPAAWVAWVAATWGAWFLVSRRLAPRLSWPIAAFPGAWLGATHAQSGLIVSALQGGFAILLRRRPFLAGLCIGAMVIKPHLAVLLPFALAAGREWRAIAGAAAGAIGCLLLAWAAFGTDTMLAYRHSWEVSRILMEQGGSEFFLRQVTVYAQMRVISGAASAAIAQALVSLFAIVLVCRVWRGPAGVEGKIALLMAAAPLATPYLFSYDLPFLVIPTIWLIRQAIEQGHKSWERPALLILYLSPLIARATALPLGINLMPLASFAMIWMIRQRLLPEGAGPKPTARG